MHLLSHFSLDCCNSTWKSLSSLSKVRPIKIVFEKEMVASIISLLWWCFYSQTFLFCHTMHLYFLWRAQAGFSPFLRLTQLKVMSQGSLFTDVTFYWLAICKDGCINGTCSKPDTCSCNAGFYGKACDTGEGKIVSIALYQGNGKNVKSSKPKALKSITPEKQRFLVRHPKRPKSVTRGQQGLLVRSSSKSKED